MLFTLGLTVAVFFKPAALAMLVVSWGVGPSLGLWIIVLPTLLALRGPATMKKTPASLYTQAATQIAEIEAEMNRIGYWSAEPLPESAYDFHLPFAMDTMAFVQWLQFILVPRVNSIVEQRGEFPASSQVGAQAVREFDGDPQADRLVSLLSEFDDLFNKGGGPSR